MNTPWNLIQNPFFWQGVVFLLFGVVVAVAVHASFGFPRRLVEAL